MQSTAARLSLFGVAMLIGLLLVAQLRAQARPVEISSLSSQELSTLIQTLSTRNKELRDGVAALREQLRDYRVAEERGQSTLDVTREELRRIMAFGGLAPVEGQGIVLEIDGSLSAVAVNDLLNELRNAGAEALAIDAVRVTAQSVAVQGARTLEIDGMPVGRAFTLSAIGDPEGLMAALLRPVFDQQSGVNLQQLFGGSDFTLIHAATILLYGGFLIPLAEEMIFRGLIFRWLRQRFDFWPAAFISAAAFGAAHIRPDQVIIAGLLGLALAWLYEKSRSLAPAILMHQTYNSLVLMMTFAVVWFPPQAQG